MPGGPFSESGRSSPFESSLRWVSENLCFWKGPAIASWLYSGRVLFSGASAKSAPDQIVKQSVLQHVLEKDRELRKHGLQKEATKAFIERCSSFSEVWS